MRSILRAAAVLFLASGVCLGAHLTPPANHAFDAYIAGVEARLVRHHVEAEDGVGVEPVHGGTWQVPGGLMHHWRGSALIPGVRAEDMLALLRDYNHLARYYAPEVVSSHALAVDGDRATLAMRFRKHRVITVVLDAEFDTQAAMDGPGRGYSISRSIHIWQVDGERRRREGDDDGFLWRLNSYWNFEETSGGLVIACEAVSLTRDVPAGLGWLITPIIQSLPRASLEFTLTATRNVLAELKNAKRYR